MIDDWVLSPDAEATILLCTSIGAPPGAVRPYGPVAWAKLSAVVRERSLGGPQALVGLSAAALADTLGLQVEDADRIAALVGRAGQLAFELDRLRSRGIWVVTVHDDAYPSRLRDRLGETAPPVLHGSGPITLLAGGGVAIVGSREVDAAATAFTERLAGAVARTGSTVVSGGARGVDATSMRAAFEAGGSVIGVLPEGVERRLREASTRSAVAGGQAVLVSPYHPSAAFSVGAAMGRNRLIYALSDVAVVVNSTEGSGGTWGGATEALSGGWVPVLVRAGEDVPTGNRALVDLGASPLEDAAVGDAVSVAELLGHVGPSVRSVAEAPAPYEQKALFSED